MNLGDTFFFAHPSAHRHLWVAAGGPSAGGEFAIFNFTTFKAGCDATCVLNAGDHPLITRQTYVTYLRGRPLHAAVLTNYAHLFSWQPPVGTALLKRIQQGALASPHTRPSLQAIVRATLVP